MTDMLRTLFAPRVGVTAEALSAASVLQEHLRKHFKPLSRTCDSLEYDCVAEMPRGFALPLGSVQCVFAYQTTRFGGQTVLEHLEASPSLACGDVRLGGVVFNHKAFGDLLTAQCNLRAASKLREFAYRDGTLRLISMHVESGAHMKHLCVPDGLVQWTENAGVTTYFPKDTATHGLIMSTGRQERAAGSPLMPAHIFALQNVAATAHALTSQPRSHEVVSALMGIQAAQSYIDGVDLPREMCADMSIMWHGISDALRVAMNCPYPHQ